LFHGLNGYRISATEDERFDLILAVAVSDLDTVKRVAALLARITQPG